MLFPANPEHGMLYEPEPGVMYQYDITINSWILVSNQPESLQLATPAKDGLMSSDDYKKLVRLLLPPPTSTIVGTNCVTPFQAGTIALYSGDDFVEINGNLEIRNKDESQQEISQTTPFQIHKDTYGFDFGINLVALKQELHDRDQLNTRGDDGDKGDKGDKGADGQSDVKAGPQGDKGEQGDAPACTLRVEPETVSSEPRFDLNRVLTGKITLEIDEEDEKKYKLIFERKIAGRDDATTYLFNVKNVNSTWVLAVESTAGNPQQPYYVDISPIIEAVHQKFLSEVTRLKVGYENIVEYWIQHMSDLFDEQKAALCCAIEFCMSKTKSINARQHMESVAAAAAGRAKIILNNRDATESVQMSSTRLLQDLGHPDICGYGPPFPYRPVPTPPCEGIYIPECNECLPEVIQMPTNIHTCQCNFDGQVTMTWNGNAWAGELACNGVFIDIVVRHTPWSIVVGSGCFPVKNGTIVYRYCEPPAFTWTIDWEAAELHMCPDCDEAQAAAAAVELNKQSSVNSVVGAFGVSTRKTSDAGKLSYDNNLVTIDAITNSGHNNAKTFELDSGKYVATITNFNYKINDKYNNNIKLQYNTDSGTKITTFLKKGEYDNLEDAQYAYNGLVLPFDHYGGKIGLYFNLLPLDSASGDVTISITKEDDINGLYCEMSNEHLRWYENGWATGKCCSLIVNIDGQDYIVVKRSIGSDDSCGGGENPITPCISKFINGLGHPAIAWPTIDGETFVNMPSGNITFVYDADLNRSVANIIESESYNTGTKHGKIKLLADFGVVLFPASI